MFHLSLALLLHIATGHSMVLTCNICNCIDTKILCNYTKLESFTLMKLGNFTLINLKGNAISRLDENSFQPNSFLESIDLSLNKIDRILHNAFHGLNNLRHLNLSFNRIQYSSLPSQIFQQLPNMNVLSLNSQSGPFRLGSLPSDIFKTLVNLKELHVTGTVDMNETLSGLVSLRILNLGDESCSTPYVSLSHFASLYKLRDLRVLSLRDCHIQYLERRFITYFPYLQRLDVSCNILLFECIEEAMGGSNQSLLEVLLMDRISGNTRQEHAQAYGMIDFDKVIPSNKLLQALSLRHNMFNGRKKVKLHKRAPHLKYLGLANTLQQLSILSGNKFLGHKFLGLGSMIIDAYLIPGLRLIDISEIGSVALHSDVVDCTKPSSLIVEQNYPWGKYSEESLCDTPCLKNLYLMLNLNSPQSFLSKYLPMSSIRKIAYRYNSFSGESLLDCEEGSYTVALDELDMSHSRSSDGSIKITCSLKGPSLLKLNFKDCGLKSITLTAFHGFPMLAQLDLSLNNLAYLIQSDHRGHLFLKSQHLSHLWLSFNGITEVPQHYFSLLASMEFLDLSHNDLRYWTISFEKNSYLKFLDLSFNAIRSVEHNVVKGFVGYQSLQVLLNNNSFLCDCSKSSFATTQWLVHDKQQYKDTKQTHGPKCSNINMSMEYWLFMKQPNECEIYRESTVNLLLIWSSPLSAVLFLCLSLVMYIKRYSIQYRMYNIREKLINKPTTLSSLPERMSLTNIWGISIKFTVYLAVEEISDITIFLLKDKIMYFSLNHQSSASGYRWKNAAQDIDAASSVIIVLCEGCLEDDDNRKDFYFSVEKKTSQIITIVVGSISTLKRNVRAVRLLVSESNVLEWPAKNPSDKQLNGLKKLLMINYHRKK